jgi:hypothetical protein
MTLFDIPANDQSVFYLSHIFGLVGTLFAPDTSTPLPTLPSMMFSALNTTALILGTLLVVYVTVIGVLATAHEGEFMGKKWSGMWIPIRMVMGIVGLFPTKSGYCAIQLIIMWIILQGVGAADQLWDVVLKFVGAAGSPFQGISISGADVSNNMQTLFKSLVCQRTAKISDSTKVGDNYIYYCGEHPTDSFCTASDTQLLNIIPENPSTNTETTITYNMGPNKGACGSLQYTNSTPLCNAASANSTDTGLALKCEAAKAQQKALITVISALDAIAQQFATADHDYWGFYLNTPTGTFVTNSSNPLVPTLTVSQPGSTPEWIQNFCTTTLQIPFNQCCNKAVVIIPPFVVIPGIPANSVSIPNTCPASSRLPSPNNTAQGGDTTNTSKDFVEKALPAYTINNISLLTPANNFVDAAVGEYIIGITSDLTDFIKNSSTAIPTDSRLATAHDQGWITAGANYYAITKAGGEKLKDAVSAISFTATGTDPLTSQDSPIKSYRNNFSAATAFINSVLAKGQKPSNLSGISPQFGSVTTNVQSSLLNTFQQCLKGGAGSSTYQTNVMSSVATFGYAMMILAQVLFAVTLVVVFALVAFGKINFIALGFGLTESPWGAALQMVLYFMMPIFISLVAALYSLGALLGIYVPLIPYVVFTVCAIGWFIATIEAMVAGPIVALGILSPSGQHEIMGKAEHAVNMLLNLFLRPSLMVLGLMMSMFLSDVVLNLINAGFLPITEDIISSPGLFEEILFISAYTSLVVMAINKSFSLVYELPNKILTWIGGQAASYGEAEALGQVQRGVEGAASATSGAAKGGAGSMVEGGQAAQKAAAEDKKEKAAEANAAKLKGSGGGGTPPAPPAPSGS